MAPNRPTLLLLLLLLLLLAEYIFLLVSGTTLLAGSFRNVLDDPWDDSSKEAVPAPPGSKDLVQHY